MVFIYFLWVFVKLIFIFGMGFFSLLFFIVVEFVFGFLDCVVGVIVFKLEYM